MVTARLRSSPRTSVSYCGKQVEHARARRELPFPDRNPGHERRDALADRLHRVHLGRRGAVEVLLDGDVAVPDDDQRVQLRDRIGLEALDERVESRGIEANLLPVPRCATIAAGQYVAPSRGSCSTGPCVSVDG